MRLKNYILVNSYRAIWANCGIGPNAACPVGMTFSKSPGMWNTETKPDSWRSLFPPTNEQPPQTHTWLRRLSRLPDIPLNHISPKIVSDIEGLQFSVVVYFPIALI